MFTALKSRSRPTWQGAQEPLMGWDGYNWEQNVIMCWSFLKIENSTKRMYLMYYLVSVNFFCFASDMLQCRDRGKNNNDVPNCFLSIIIMSKVNRYPREAQLLGQGAPLCETHDYKKVITTWTQKHSVATLSHNSIHVIWLLQELGLCSFFSGATVNFRLERRLEGLR